MIFSQSLHVKTLPSVVKMSWPNSSRKAFIRFEALFASFGILGCDFKLVEEWYDDKTQFQEIRKRNLTMLNTTVSLSQKTFEQREDWLDTRGGENKQSELHVPRESRADRERRR